LTAEGSERREKMPTDDDATTDSSFRSSHPISLEQSKKEAQRAVESDQSD